MAEPMPILPDDQEPTCRGFLTGHGGTDLAYARWEHPAPRGRVVIAHGYGEHGERYRHLAHWLQRQGWSVSSLDHRGFGRSGGRRGDAAGIRGPVADLTLFLRQERLWDAERGGLRPRPEARPGPACPQVLLGHSYGGLLALLTLLWHPETLDGLILTSPALRLRPLPVLLDGLRRLLSWVAPHLGLNLPNDKSQVCSDPVFVQRYWDDPLCHRTITAGFVAAMAEGRDELLPLGAELDRPILLLEAGLDTVADPDGAEPLWQAVRPGLLERHRLAGVRHEVFHDLLRDHALELTNTWLDRVFPVGPGTIAPLTATCN
jgi:alpha-beta hydrolase superfamily lysophospholipase